MKFRKYSSGFTLIELLVVIAIIGLLSAIVLASLTSARERAQDAKAIQAVQQMKTELELYALNNGGEYPPMAAVLNDKHYASADQNFLATLFGVKNAYAQTAATCVRSITSNSWTAKMKSIDNIPDNANHDFCLKYYYDSTNKLAAVYTNLITDKDTSGSNTFTRKYGAVFGVKNAQDLVTLCQDAGYPAFGVGLNGQNRSVTCSGSTPFDKVAGVQSGAPISVSNTATDNDEDGYFTPDDCDDGNSAINPGASEIQGDGVDQNCNGDNDEYNYTCQGTPTVNCSERGNESDCNNAYVCAWGGETNYSCSGSYSTTNACSNFNGNGPSCSNTSGCTWYGDSGSCSDLNYDEYSCNSNTSGACYYNEDYCQGGTYTRQDSGNCSGEYMTSTSCEGLGEQTCSYYQSSGCYYTPSSGSYCSSNNLSCENLSNDMCNSIPGCNLQ